MAFLINGVELEFDMLDADDNQRVAQAVMQTAKEADALKNNGVNDHEGITQTCIVIFNCFNAIFGDGTDKKIFGDKCNLGIALKAFHALVSEKERQEAVFESSMNELALKYSPDRVKR